jgi:hypothetical protein
VAKFTTTLATDEPRDVGVGLADVDDSRQKCAMGARYDTIGSNYAEMRRRHNVAFGVSFLLVMLGGASCFGDDDSTPAQAKGKGGSRWSTRRTSSGPSTVTR